MVNMPKSSRNTDGEGTGIERAERQEKKTVQDVKSSRKSLKVPEEHMCGPFLDRVGEFHRTLTRIGRWLREFLYWR